MAIDPVRNFAITTVATVPSPADSGTTLVVASGEGALFPDPSSSGEFNVVVYPNGEQPTSSNAEIVRVTARTTDTLTIEREQESTSARTILEGDVVLMAITKKMVDDISDVADAADQKIQDFNGGWIDPNETWTYASATTITVPSGAASRYQKGMPFKLTANSVELQGYIVSIADTVLTVVGDALTNHTFTNNYYGLSGTVPFGFDDVFHYTPTLTAAGSMTISSVAIDYAYYFIRGNMVYLAVRVNFTTGGSASNSVSVSRPFVVSAGNGAGGGFVTDSGFKGACVGGDVNNLTVFKYDASNWGTSTSRQIRAYQWERI
jgi:hypothetical protein